MNNPVLQKAIEFIKTGKKEAAQVLLKDLIKGDPHNIPAWFWYIETLSTTEKRLQVLDACLRNNPEHPQVALAIQNLRTRQATGGAPPPSLQPQEAGPQIRKTVPPERPPAPPPIAARSSHSHEPQMQKKKAGWLIPAIALTVVLGIMGAGAWTVLRSPPDPAGFRHTEPYEFFLYVPKDYSPERAWPVFVGIHGQGGSGLDCWTLWQSYAEQEGFILVCPSIADQHGGWYQDDGERIVLQVLSQVRTDYHLEPRIFLVGFSAGAQFVQGFAFGYPQLVAGVAVLSAGNYYAPTGNARNIPFLVVIGTLDDSTSIAYCEEFVASLQRNGYTVAYHPLPFLGHAVNGSGRRLTIEFFANLNAIAP
ncbi:MAG: hypothetical protein JXB85_04310 [Anaerolineales bacterium]|nr:hypothetical protein [Anaerolineales bacterium]